ncbi:class E sortase [Phytohabitans sp. ZYX-F-186]|uniref:Class E sortase n=1 Tax=Phytohabitans maris TaxID=3071409 RepID=A0ABU0ZVC4_9ACTN|nr:class E sortase [Phytohabitans sp. ZYX-F-186]MDQ7910994.1 class E sortase [Phytohabitans sp. ZYX-F-186]
MSGRAGAALRIATRTLGELMTTLGLVTMLFAGYAVWGQTGAIDARQGQLDQQLDERWGASGDAPTVGPATPAPSGGGSKAPGNRSGSGDQGGPPGEAVARLHIPKLGKRWVVVEGVRSRDIRYAPGHYPGTALPGEVGNFSVAGHRTPAIFWRLDEVRSSDVIVVETRTSWYVYRVTGLSVVKPDAVEVIAPAPGSRGGAPTAKLLTLTTCHPKWSNGHRLVVRAELVRAQERVAGSPAELRS